MSGVHKRPPAACDICGRPIKDAFIDGKTHGGPWADMCRSCFAEHGVGLGTGKGQLYERNGDAPAFVKTGG